MSEPEIKPRIDEEWMIEDCGDRIFLGVPRKAVDKLDRIITYWDVTGYTEAARSVVLNDANEIVAARRMARELATEKLFSEIAANTYEDEHKNASGWRRRAEQAEAELAEAIGQTDLYKERIQQLYASHARKDVELARLRVEVEAWRGGRLLFHQGRHDYELVVNVGLTHDPKMTIHRFTTIEDAVDALIAEREEVTP